MKTVSEDIAEKGIIILMKKHKWIIVLIVIFLLYQFKYGPLAPFDKLDFSSTEVNSMRLYSEGHEAESIYTDSKNIERIIESINGSRMAGIGVGLPKSSLPPYGIEFCLKDGTVVGFRFLLMEYDADSGIAEMGRMSNGEGGIGKGKFKGDLFYIFQELWEGPDLPYGYYE